jgi:uncharacterized protein (DUF305 family)
MSHRVPSLAILTAVALAAAACSDSATAPRTPNVPAGPSFSQPAPQPSVAKLEIDYMMETIDHHLAGIVMATLCVQRVPQPLLHEDAQLVQLCQESIASQQRQINLYRQWLSAWYGIDYEGEITRSAEQDIERLSELFGEDFENEFLTEFSKHHLQIIKQSEHVVRRAFHEQLRQEALMTIVNQSRGVIRMQTWDCAWFGDCRQGLKEQAERFLAEYA